MSPSRRQSDALRLAIGRALSDRAYTAPREAITNGRYLPGTRLIERALATNPGVSHAPVHEALRRLEYERLIGRDFVRPTDAERNLLLSTCDEAAELLRVPDLDAPTHKLRAITRRFRELLELEAPRRRTRHQASRRGDRRAGHARTHPRTRHPDHPSRIGAIGSRPASRLLAEALRDEAPKPHHPRTAIAKLP